MGTFIKPLRSVFGISLKTVILFKEIYREVINQETGKLIKKYRR